MDLSLLKPILTYEGAPVVPKTVLAHKVWVGIAFFSKKPMGCNRWRFPKLIKGFHDICSECLRCRHQDLLQCQCRRSLLVGLQHH